MADLTLGQNNISVVVSDTTGNMAIVNTGGDSGNSLTTFESSRGQKLASDSIPVVICNEQATQSYFITDQITVGLSVVQLSSNIIENSINIKASSSNNGNIYIGNSNSLTISNGYELVAGESITLPIIDSNLIYLIADLDSQKVSFIGS